VDSSTFRKNLTRFSLGWLSYNLPMLRATAYSLLVASLVTGSLLAQRVGGGSHGGSVSFTHSGAAAQRVFRGSVSVRPFSHHHNRTGAFWYPYDGSYDYGEPYPEPVTQPVPVVVQQPAAQPAPIEPKIIEVPGAANAASAKPLPPTVFILRNGERLETYRYLLRANNLSVTINRRQRIIPLDQLDLDSTIAANRDRGLDLEIPADPNEISLRF
jgi:hypothetical protein